MRSLARLLSSTVLLSAMLVPSTGRTDAAHSWCVPGGPKSSPSNSGDPNTDIVVNYVSAITTPILTAARATGDGVSGARRRGRSMPRARN